MNRQLDDIPSVEVPMVQEGVPSPGDLLCDEPDEEFRRRLKYLLLYLSQNETAITLAKFHGLEFVEVEGVLAPTGPVDVGRRFNLECYADLELRIFFDALGIYVQQ